MAVFRYPFVGPGRFPSTPTPQYVVVDLEAELPAIGVTEGDLGYAKDSDKVFRRTAATWVEIAAGAAGAPTDATYITQTPNATLTNEQALNALANGLLKHAAGVVARAVPGTDFYQPGGTDVGIADGGTGQSSALAGFNALSPLTTKGDLLTRDAANNVRKPAGSDGLGLAYDGDQADGLLAASPWKTGRRQTLADGVTTDMFEVGCTDGNLCGGLVAYLVRCKDGTPVMQTQAGIHVYVGWNIGGTVTVDESAMGTTPKNRVSAGTLTIVLSVAAGVNKLIFRCQVTSSLVPTVLDIQYWVLDCSQAGQSVLFL